MPGWLRADDPLSQGRDREQDHIVLVPPPNALAFALEHADHLARSLLGDPKIIILDEPTAALGVAQTAEVLNLVERLRENGLGVIMISHNMADVKAVADKVAVLRLGRNNGLFDVGDVSAEDIIAAITGATDNAVARRASRRQEGLPS